MPPLGGVHSCGGHIEEPEQREQLEQVLQVSAELQGVLRRGAEAAMRRH